MSITGRTGSLARRLDAVEASVAAKARRRQVDWAAVRAAGEAKFAQWVERMAREYPDGWPPLSEEEQQAAHADIQRMLAEGRALAAELCAP